MRLEITRPATADLEEIGAYIAADNPRRAIAFVNELVARCERLLTAPLGYPLIPRYEPSGVRRCTHGRYLIFYRVLPKRIEILHILHGARDYERILFPDD